MGETMGIRRVAVAVSVLLAAASSAQAQGLMDVGKAVLQNQVQQQLGAPQSSGGSSSNLGSSLSVGDIAGGLKDALKAGTERVTARLGATDGYNADPKVHIPLPESLRTAQSALRLAGASGLADDLELKLNRAAEAAAPKAKAIFWDAVQKMTVDDARAILNGPKDAATQYFKRTMTPDLKTAMRPVVDRTVSEAGAVQAYDSVVGSARLPMVGDGKSMLSDYVLGKALDGMFGYLGAEEAAIRTDPAKRSTDLMKKVFGG
jgi:hypothetical protein